MRGFSTYHPAVLLAFFTGAVILTIMVQRPLLQGIAFAAALCLYMCIRGRGAWRFTAGLIVAFAVIAAINPLFNTNGETVLFSYFGRPYTLEALALGASTGAMFVTIVLWFSSYSRIVTSDMLVYLFWHFAPASTLLLVIVLRLVPSYRRRALRIASARTCIGKSPSAGSLSQRIKACAAVLSSLTTWSLEGSITTADSMRSRGYGTARRSSYARYRMGTRDIFVLLVLALAFVASCALLAIGAAPIEFLPAIHIPVLRLEGIVLVALFGLYALLPTLVYVGEGVSWRLSVSRI